MRIITITRIYDAPRELVWRAWTEPERLATWWGKRGWTAIPESIVIDARPGGVFRVTTVNELAEPFPITIQAVSKHLKVLERAGLITRGRSAQLRPSRLEGAPLREAAAWLETYSRLWQGSFDRLDERLHG